MSRKSGIIYETEKGEFGLAVNAEQHKSFEQLNMTKIKIPVPSEKVVHQQICDFLKLQYPDIIFTSDASGMRVSIGLRVELKRKRCTKYKIPDLIILHPSKGYYGLVLEIKKRGEKITNGKGEYVNDHIKEQALSLLKFKQLGYAASFAIGYEEAEGIIKDYLK